MPLFHPYFYSALMQSGARTTFLVRQHIWRAKFRASENRSPTRSVKTFRYYRECASAVRLTSEKSADRRASDSASFRPSRMWLKSRVQVGWMDVPGIAKDANTGVVVQRELVACIV